jgi:prepilin-type N-terminal cleavage/methylation domain-containing protein
MMRDRLVDERGFTLIELLVVFIIIGTLAAIALAVFLNSRDKGLDASAKSDVTNLVHEIQACNSGRPDKEDFQDCDSAAKLGPTNLAISSDAPRAASGDCADATAADTVTGGTVRILESGPDCFVVLGISKGGNRFWFVMHNGGSASRDCTTHGVNGCPTDGIWAR